MTFSWFHLDLQKWNESIYGSFYILQVPCMKYDIDLNIKGYAIS